MAQESNRYTKSSILKSEEIYSTGFQAPGGMELANLFIKTINSNPKNILVFGCGTGGGTKIMSKRFPNSKIIAIDNSQNMIDICNSRYNLDNVEFMLNDGSDRIFFNQQTFDLIWSRDVILYIEDKETLFNNFYSWLKHGGKLLVCDFGCNDIKSPELLTYLDGKDYYLYNKNSYLSILENSNFQNLNLEDYTSLFEKTNRAELSIFKEQSDNFINKYSKEDYDHYIERWDNKIRLSKNDQLCYYLLSGEKRRLRIYIPVACDLFHYGHLTLFKNVKQKFPNCVLIIGICDDNTIYSYKNKYPILSLKERVYTVSDSQNVDEIIEAAPTNTDLNFMKEHNIDYCACTTDYNESKVNEYFPNLEIDKNLFIFPYTKTISTTEIIRRIKNDK